MAATKKAYAICDLGHGIGAKRYDVPAGGEIPAEAMAGLEEGVHFTFVKPGALDEEPEPTPEPAKPEQKPDAKKS